MIRNPLILTVAAVAVLGLSTGGAFAAGRATGQETGAAKARQDTISELQGQFQQALARSQAAATESAAQASPETAPSGATARPGGLGQTGTGAGPGAFFGGGQGGGGFGGLRGLAGLGLTGQVEKIDGNSVTVTLPQGVTLTANLSEKTTFRRTVAGSKTDIKQGSEITVEGERQADGTLQATQITLVSGGG